ncbi:MAG: hypothetical protein ACKPKO_44115, partial [Candidatus Fonsibacter sp.]
MKLIGQCSNAFDFAGLFLSMDTRCQLQPAVFVAGNKGLGFLVEADAQVQQRIWFAIMYLFMATG